MTSPVVGNNHQQVDAPGDELRVDQTVEQDHHLGLATVDRVGLEQLPAFLLAPAVCSGSRGVLTAVHQYHHISKIILKFWSGQYILCRCTDQQKNQAFWIG